MPSLTLSLSQGVALVRQAHHERANEEVSDSSPGTIFSFASYCDDVVVVVVDVSGGSV